MADASPAADEFPDELDDAACQRGLKLIFDACTALAVELQAPSADLTPVARANALDRVAQAARRTILLARHIRANPIQSDTGSAERRRTEHRQHVIRHVETEIVNKAEAAEAPQLRLELLERIDDPEFEIALATRPRAELIRELCCDLGLADLPGRYTFPRRTPDDVAILQAQAAAPAGSGLPRWFAVAQAQPDPLSSSPSPPGRGSG